MKIETLALNATTKEGDHLSKRVWDISRGTTDAKESQILKVDAPVNEMPSVVLMISSTVLEREVIAGIKEHSMWASSSRVDDVTFFEIDENAKGEANDFAEQSRKEMRRQRDDGVGQDRFRLMLPILSMTHYTVRLNMRACAILSQYFSYLADMNPDTELIFRSASSEFSSVTNCLGGGVNYKFAEILGEYTALKCEDSATTIGEFTVVRHNTIFSLRTHTIRHRLFSLADDLKGWIITGVARKTLSSPMLIDVAASNNAWLSVGTKRACWLAQSDLWTPMLKLAGDSIGGGLMDALPCDDGVCPFKRDVQLRLEGKDPNAPCPKYLDMYGVVPSGNQLVAIEKELSQGKRSDYWLNSGWL